jgi:hypothetical protein
MRMEIQQVKEYETARITIMMERQRETARVKAAAYTAALQRKRATSVTQKATPPIVMEYRA